MIPPPRGEAAASVTVSVSLISTSPQGFSALAAGMGAQPALEVGVRDDVHARVHVGVVDPAQLGAADGEGAELAGRHADGGDLTRVGVDLGAHLHDPEGVHDVL